MSTYQVWLVERPSQWRPVTPDAAPPAAGEPTVVAEADDLFVAVQTAIEHNEAALQGSDQRGKWAVVVEPLASGRIWHGARLCTPLAYKVAGVWWPAGWEPQTPLDVPKCIRKTQDGAHHEEVTYRQAVATVAALNRQSMDHAGALWYVVIAVENEPVSSSVSYAPDGTETTTEVRQLHVVRAEQGGPGDCTHCPARAMDCPTDTEQTITEVTTRAV
jgi:hypothetical protein